MKMDKLVKFSGEKTARIRDAHLEDLPQIVEIYNTTVESRVATADLEPVSVESRLHWFNAHSRGFRPLWVFETQEGVLGWLSYQSFYGRPAYNATAELSVYISPNWRKNGIGRILLSEAVEQSPCLGIKNLLGFIFGHNEPSLNLFKASGFKQWAYLPGIAELDGIERDLVILGYKI